MQASLPTTTPGFLAGLMYPLRGMRFVFREHRELARYWLVPVLLMLIGGVALLWTVVAQHDAIVGWLWVAPVGDGLATTLLAWLHALVTFLISVIAFAIGCLVLLVVCNLVAAPFNEALSAQVERIQGQSVVTDFSLKEFAVDLLRSVRMEITKALVFAALMIPLAILNLVLPFLAPVVTLVGLSLTILYIAIDYTDWPSARRGFSLNDRVALWGPHVPALIGFGVTSWLLLFVPGLNLLLMPGAVAGGTLLYLDVEVARRNEASA